MVDIKYEKAKKEIIDAFLSVIQGSRLELKGNGVYHKVIIENEHIFLFSTDFKGGEVFLESKLDNYYFYCFCRKHQGDCIDIPHSLMFDSIFVGVNDNPKIIRVHINPIYQSYVVDTGLIYGGNFSELKINDIRINKKLEYVFKIFDEM